jgi:hypothetical protein
VARAETNASANFDVLLYRGVSGPLAAQTIGGNLDGVLGVLESNVAADFAWHLHVYVAQGDSDTPRATLITDYVETTSNEWPTTATFRALASAQALSASISAGDRLVVEIGYVALNASATSRTGTLNYGTQVAFQNVADGVAGQTDVTLKAGFISFSQALDEQPVATRGTAQYGLALSIADETLRATAAYTLALTTVPIELRATAQYVLTLYADPLPTPVPPPPVDVSALAAIEMCFGGSYRSWLRRR